MYWLLSMSEWCFWQVQVFLVSAAALTAGQWLQCVCVDAGCGGWGVCVPVYLLFPPRVLGCGSPSPPPPLRVDVRRCWDALLQDSVVSPLTASPSRHVVEQSTFKGFFYHCCCVLSTDHGQVTSRLVFWVIQPCGWGCIKSSRDLSSPFLAWDVQTQNLSINQSL